MTTPVIGITTYAQDKERQFPLPRAYVDCTRRAGAIPVLLPPGESQPERLFAMLDGLILTGGGDLTPSTYQGKSHETIGGTDLERDDTELQLAREAIQSGFPTLAICRGLQVVNVVQGGTLIPHLPDEVGNQVVHQQPPQDPTEHVIHVREGCRLAKVLQATDFLAASWHHQAIGDVGRGLNVLAHAPDGTIEAVDMPDHPWLVAVQWHPELTADRDPVQQRLFDEFVAATRRLMRKR